MSIESFTVTVYSLPADNFSPVCHVWAKPFVNRKCEGDGTSGDNGGDPIGVAIAGKLLAAVFIRTFPEGSIGELIFI